MDVNPETLQVKFQGQSLSARDKASKLSDAMKRRNLAHPSISAMDRKREIGRRVSKALECGHE